MINFRGASIALVACCVCAAWTQKRPNDAALLQVAPAKLTSVAAEDHDVQTQGQVASSDAHGTKAGSFLQEFESISKGNATSPGKLAPVWLVWVGSNPMHPLNLAAVESCFRANQDEFDVRLVRDDDLRDSVNRLGFELHPSFHLLDAPEKSDYLRAEFLYHHGGFYFDTDVFCMRSLRHAFEASQAYEASGIENVATIGPFRQHGMFITNWHENLHKKMDEITPRLQNCARLHPDGNDGIAYPTRVKEGDNICGTIWGEVIDFEQNVSRSLDTKGYFGKALSLCMLDGERWVASMYALPGAETAPCDIVHASTAKLAYDLVDVPAADLCSRFDILRQSPSVCPMFF